MDFKAIIEESPLYTLHSHTQFCDGHATMQEFAEAAARSGFRHYGFTPHSPIPIESPCNMRQEDVPAYLAEVKRLQQEFPQVHFYAGMEVDYINDHWGPASPYFQNLGLDYIIGSVHFIPNQRGEWIDIDGRFDRFRQNMEEHFDNDIEYVVNTFFDQSERMIAAGGFDIIGHFDKIKHNGGLYLEGLEETELYRRRIDHLIEMIIEARLTIEINTKAWKEHGQLFPAQRHWERLHRAGLTIVVNSDAHYPSLIDASRPAVMRALAYIQKK